MVDDRAPNLRRRGLHCLAAALVTAIIAVTVAGLAAPWSVDVLVPLSSDIQEFYPSGIVEVVTDPAVAGALCAVLVGALVVGWLGWAVVAQRRRPWPLGPRSSGSQSNGPWPLLGWPVFTALVIAGWLGDPFRELVGLAFTPIEGYWMELRAPIDLAIEIVLGLATYVTVAIPGYLLAKALQRRRDARDARERMGVATASPGVGT